MSTAETRSLIPPESKEFAGKVVLISGGSTGIGRSTASHFINEGAQVGVLDVGERPDFLPESSFHHIDVSDWKSVNQSINELAQNLGGLDIVINNAATKVGGNILDVSSEEFERLLKVNGLGFWNVAKAAIPHLIKSHGTLINVCSGTSQSLPPNNDGYFASKGVSYSLTHALASSFQDRVRVLGIAPNPVDTPLWRTGQSEERIQAALSGRSGPKVLKPDNIAQMILSLASRKNSALDGRIYSY